MNVYRVRFSHEDSDHHVSEPAFYGPAFDDSFASTVFEATGETPNRRESAAKCAERCRGEHPDGEGYTTVVVQLIDNGDGTGRWEEVA